MSRLLLIPIGIAELIFIGLTWSLVEELGYDMGGGDRITGIGLLIGMMIVVAFVATLGYMVIVGVK